MGNFDYVVSPPHRTFDTRHDAVGFKAIHERRYTYGASDLRLAVFRGGLDG